MNGILLLRAIPIFQCFRVLLKEVLLRPFQFSLFFNFQGRFDNIHSESRILSLLCLLYHRTQVGEILLRRLKV